MLPTFEGLAVGVRATSTNGTFAARLRARDDFLIADRRGRQRAAQHIVQRMIGLRLRGLFVIHINLNLQGAEAMPKRIEGQFDAKSFMELGDQFFHAVRVLSAVPGPQKVLAATPVITSSAFTIEIYFKLLTHIERNLMPLKTHHLLHLFNDLTDATRDEIEQTWTTHELPGIQRQATLPQLPKEFPKVENLRQALEMGGDAFVDWRYAPRSKNRAFFLMGLIPIARDAVLKRKPDLNLAINIGEVRNPQP